MTPAEFTASGVWISNCLSVPTYASLATLPTEIAIPVASYPASLFNPTKLDFDEWMDWAEKLNATGVMLINKHPDGFCLWPSQVTSGGQQRTVAQTPWYAAHGQIDVWKLWCDTARRHGLRVGAYFSVWDEFRESLAGGTPASVGSTAYTQWTVDQLTEMLDPDVYGDIDFIFLDGWGNTWTGIGGVGFTDVVYQTIYDLVKTIQPGCVVGVNDHEDGSETPRHGDVSIWEHPVDGEPLAGQITNFTAAMLHDPLRASASNSGPWFDHTDGGTVVNTDAAKHVARRYRMSRLSNPSVVYFLNFSDWLDGKLAADTIVGLSEMTTPQRPLVGADLFALAPTESAGVALNVHTSQHDGGTWTRLFGSVHASIDPYGEMRVNDATGVEYTYSVAPGSADYQVEVDFKLLSVPSSFVVMPLIRVASASVDNRFRIEWNGALWTFQLQRNNSGVAGLSYFDGAALANPPNSNIPPTTPQAGYRYRAVLRKVGNTLTGEMWIDPSGGTDFEYWAETIATETVVTGAGSGGFFLNGTSSASTGVHVTAFRIRGIDTSAPTAPVMEAPAARDDGVRLRWTGSPADLWKFKIYRSTDGVTYTFLGNSTTSEFFDDTAVLGVEYKYYVKSIDTSYNVSAASNVVAGSLVESVTSVDFTQEDRDRLNALVPYVTTGIANVVSATELWLLLPEPYLAGANGLWVGYDIILYDTSNAGRESRRRIVASTQQATVLLSVTLDAVPDFTVAADDSAAIVMASRQFERLVTEVSTAGAANRPVNQTSVPLSRTWLLKTSDNGLVGELPITISKSATSRLFAVDFRNDLSSNGRVSACTGASVIEGTPANITFGADLSNVTDYGADRSQAKVRITAPTAGTYKLRIAATYDPADGGGGGAGDVILVVTD